METIALVMISQGWLMVSRVVSDKGDKITCWTYAALWAVLALAVAVFQ